MEALIKGDPKNAIIAGFFSQSMLVKKEKKKANCVAAPGFLGGSDECVSQEKTSSRWEDLQLSMYLLGNAFRMDSGKPPEKVKQVKQAKLFFAEVEKLKKASAAGNAKEAALRYALAREALDVYLNDVELPPTFVPNEYVAPTDVTVPPLCQGCSVFEEESSNEIVYAHAHMCIPGIAPGSRGRSPSVMCRPTDAPPRREGLRGRLRRAGQLLAPRDRRPGALVEVEEDRLDHRVGAGDLAGDARLPRHTSDAKSVSSPRSRHASAFKSERFELSEPPSLPHFTLFHRRSPMNMVPDLENRSQPTMAAAAARLPVKMNEVHAAARRRTASPPP